MPADGSPYTSPGSRVVARPFDFPHPAAEKFWNAPRRFEAELLAGVRIVYGSEHVFDTELRLEDLAYSAVANAPEDLSGLSEDDLLRLRHAAMRAWFREQGRSDIISDLFGKINAEEDARKMGRAA